MVRSFFYLSLIFKTVNGRRNIAAAQNKARGIASVYRHNGRAPQQTAKADFVPHRFARRGNNPHSRRFIVNHSNRRFVCNHSGNRRRRRIAGNGNHIQADTTNTSHSFQFIQRNRAAFCRANHADIFGNGNKRARQTANARRSHHAAFFHSVV